MSSEEIEKNDRSADALERIADCLEKVVDQTRPDNTESPVVVDASTGSCPSCGAMEVTMIGDYPNNLYKCTSCEQMWVNDENTLFSS